MPGSTTGEHSRKLPSNPIICQYHRLNINNGPSIPGIYVKQMTEYDSTAISDTQLQYMTTVEKVDTSDLMMIIRWVINISFQSHELEWASSTHATPYITKKVIERNNTILDTLSTWYTQQAFFVLNACEWSWLMMIMRGSSRLRPYGHYVFCLWHTS